MQVAEYWMTDSKNVGLSVDMHGTLVWSILMPDLAVLLEPEGGFSLAKTAGDKTLYDAWSFRNCLTERELVRLFNPDGSGVVERWKFTISAKGLVDLYGMYRGITLPHDIVSLGQPVIHTGKLHIYNRNLINWRMGKNPMGTLRT